MQADGASAQGFGYTARRGCSLAPLPFWSFFLGLCVACAVLGVLWTLAGAWPVLPFACLEIAAVLAILVAYVRHIGDYERITLGREGLVLEVRECDTVRRHVFNPRWVTLAAAPTAADGRLALRYGGREYDIGRHLDDEGRRRLAFRLGEVLRRQ